MIITIKRNNSNGFMPAWYEYKITNSGKAEGLTSVTTETIEECDFFNKYFISNNQHDRILISVDTLNECASYLSRFNNVAYDIKKIIKEFTNK